MTPPEAIARLFGAKGVAPNFPPRWNLAPTQDGLVVRYNPETGERSLDVLRWGLIPHWAKDASLASKLINARADSIADKPAFRDAFRRRRCLVPADAFYEWQKATHPKQPFAIRGKDHAPFAMAGLWENWKNPDGEWQRTYTILTTDANALIAPLHDRMPVILPKESHSLWLGEESAEPDTLLALLKPCPERGLEAYPVGLAVNNVHNDGAALLEPRGEGK